MLLTNYLDQGAAHDQTWSWSQVRTVLTDWKAYYFAVIYCLTGVSGSGVKLALPSIIDGMGDWSPDVSQALTTPPYILASILILVASYYSGISNVFFFLTCFKYSSE